MPVWEGRQGAEAALVPLLCVVLHGLGHATWTVHSPRPKPVQTPRHTDWALMSSPPPPIQIYGGNCTEAETGFGPSLVHRLLGTGRPPPPLFRCTCRRLPQRLLGQNVG